MKESDMRDTAGASPTPEYLNAFLDGELTADERAHVLTLLESDERERDTRKVDAKGAPFSRPS